MYQLKVRIAGEAWQVCLVVTATLMCVFALFGQPFSPVGMIGVAFTAVTVILPMIMQGSWNRRYYSALSTFPGGSPGRPVRQHGLSTLSRIQ